MREASRRNWRSGDSTPEINAGSLQRIADAMERQSEVLASICGHLSTLAANSHASTKLYKQQTLRERTKRLIAEKKLKALTK